MKKLLTYSILSLSLFSLVGIGLASAHGHFMRFSDVSPEEITQGQEAMFERKAEVLGISVDEFKNAWAQGKNFAEIAEEYGISHEDLQQRMKELNQERMQSQLQAMVDSGVITQEQADQRFDNMQNRFENGFGKKGFHRGFGECPNR